MKRRGGGQSRVLSLGENFLVVKTIMLDGDELSRSLLSVRDSDKHVCERTARAKHSVADMATDLCRKRRVLLAGISPFLSRCKSVDWQFGLV